MGLENIEHVVVVMFESRSFDNLLGWLYDNTSNPPTFEGLSADTYFNLLAIEKAFATSLTEGE